ncbi:cell division protein FtsQ/DivIB [Candidatus Latescibacterota bacterium]
MKQSRKKHNFVKSRGLGRYLIALLAFGLLLHFAGRPLIARIKSHPIFTVRNVVVEGARYLEQNEIIKTSSVEMGANIFDIDLRMISQSLKEVYTAEYFAVYRRLPDTITIRISERKPVALLNMKTLIGIDADGVPLPHIDASFVETLPIMTGISNLKSLSDSTVKARLTTGLMLLEIISEDTPGIYQRISEIDVTNVAELGITLVDNGLEVIIGANDWARKISTLDRVIDEVLERVETVKAVDIRFGEKIYVR